MALGRSRTAGSTARRPISPVVGQPTGEIGLLAVDPAVRDGFGPITDCWIDGKKTNFARWLTDNAVDTKLPLIADYNGALINVSIQTVDPKAGTVSLYAPVFADRMYRLAKPMPDYVQGFRSVTAGPTHDLAFACNCTLNYVYGKLAGARVGLPGPFTFGEIAYQLLN